jgi:hypothetical protein
MPLDEIAERRFDQGLQGFHICIVAEFFEKVNRYEAADEWKYSPRGE